MQKQPPKVFSNKKLFLEISLNSQENNCARVSFLIKWQVSNLQFIKKRGFGTGVFLWILRNFYEHLFYRTPLGHCFWKYLLFFSAIECVRYLQKMMFTVYFKWDTWEIEIRELFVRLSTFSFISQMIELTTFQIFINKDVALCTFIQV